MDQAVPVKAVKCFANNKPWITAGVKEVLNKKKRVFRSRDWVMLRKVQK